MTDQDRLEQLRRSLTNIPPTLEQIDRIEELRSKAKLFGEEIIASCPDARERSLALTHLEDCCMWAVKAIVLE